MLSNRLYYGDNLDILRNREYFPNECIDLIYLDPPFNSNRNYNVLFKEASGKQSEAQVTAFVDMWEWSTTTSRIYEELITTASVHHAPPRVGVALSAFRQIVGDNSTLAYLTMMTARLIELYRVLKPTGSLFLHCDPTASHYLKVILDSIFGEDNFRNEIIWRRTGSHNSKRSFGPIHDTILFYSKSKKYKFNVIKRPYMRAHVERRYSPDENGELKFTSGGNVLTGAGATNGQSGATWKGFNPTAKNRHWAIPKFLAEQMPPEFGKLDILEKLDELFEAGLIDIKEGNAWPTPVRFLRPSDGQSMQDIWAMQPYTEGTVFGTDECIDADVAWLGPTDPERLGYQTQKPIGLLERIIKATTDPGDLVLDPFSGCGTTVAAAQKLKRHWIGIDITHLGISLLKLRLNDMFKLKPIQDYNVIGEPEDLEAARYLAKQEENGRYQFQYWALSLIQARPIAKDNKPKKGKDDGIDGIIAFIDDMSEKRKQINIQVKSGNVKSGDIRDLIGTLKGDTAVMGVFLTLEPPTRDMMTTAASAGFYASPGWGKSFPRLQILTVEDLLAGKQPDLPPANVSFKKAEGHNQYDNANLYAGKKLV